MCFKESLLHVTIYKNWSKLQHLSRIVIPDYFQNWHFRHWNHASGHLQWKSLLAIYKSWSKLQDLNKVVIPVWSQNRHFRHWNHTSGHLQLSAGGKSKQLLVINFMHKARLERDREICEFPVCEMRVNINSNNNNTHKPAISILRNQSATWATSVRNGDVWQWRHQFAMAASTLIVTSLS